MPVCTFDLRICEHIVKVWKETCLGIIFNAVDGATAASDPREIEILAHLLRHVFVVTGRAMVFVTGSVPATF